MKRYLAKLNKKIYISLALAGGGILYLKVLSPKFGIHIPCLFNHFTGYDCPGCGMTRASLAILDGDIYQAFRFNMLIFLILPLLVVHQVLEKKGKRKTSTFLINTMLVITVLFGVLRNFEPFSWLGPTDN